MVYHPKDVRDEKVRSALAHWEHGEIETLNPSGIRQIHGNSMDFPWIINEIAAECHPDKTPTDFRRNLDGIATECHPDKTPTDSGRVTFRRIPSMIHGKSTEFRAITVTLEAITVPVTLEAAELNEGRLNNQYIPFDFTLTQDTLFNLSIQTEGAIIFYLEEAVCL